jgi:hypothetical protein
MGLDEQTPPIMCIVCYLLLCPCFLVINLLAPTLSVAIIYLLIFTTVSTSTTHYYEDFILFFSSDDLRRIDLYEQNNTGGFGSIICTSGFIRNIVLSIVLSFCLWIPGLLFSTFLWGVFFYGFSGGCLKSITEN